MPLPGAPHQQLNKSSWEQLNTIFNSVPTTEVKIIVKMLPNRRGSGGSVRESQTAFLLCPVFPQQGRGRELTEPQPVTDAFTQLSAAAPCGIRGPFYSSFSLLLSFFFPSVDTDMRINMYCLSDFVVVYERSSAEGTIMWLITGICLVLVMEEIKFLQKFLFFFFLFFFFSPLWYKKRNYSKQYIYCLMLSGK